MSKMPAKRKKPTRSTRKKAPVKAPQIQVPIEAPAEVASPAKEPLGGWLIVLVVAIGLGIIMNIGTLAGNINALSDSSSEVLRLYPSLHGVIIYEICGLAAAIVGAGAVLYYLFQRKRVAKLLVTIFFLATLLFGLVDIALLNGILRGNREMLQAINDSGTLLRAIIGSLVWIPYIWLSKRVARTMER